MSAANTPNESPLLSRRAAMRILSLPAGVWLLSGCGGPTVPASELGFSPGFAGARIRAILRNTFIDELNMHARELGNRWSEISDASIEFDFSDDWRERYAATARAREGEDLAELFGNGPHLFSDRLMDLSALAEEIGDTQGGWMDAARDAAMVDGIWRGIPWAFSAQAINCRTDLMEQINQTSIKTYDQLLEVATELNENGLPLAAFSMSPDAPNDAASFAYSLLWSFGGQEVDEATGKVALDSASTRAALEYFVQLVEVSDRRSLAFSEGGNNAAFLRGEIAMTQNSSSIYWKALQDDSDLLDVIEHHRYPEGPNGYHQLLEMNTLAVFKHSRNADAASDFIRFAMSPDSLRDRGNLSFSFFSPPLLDRIEDPAMVWNTNPVFATLKGSNEGGHVAGWPAEPTIEAGLVFQNATLANMFGSVGSGEASVPEAIATASHALRRVYET